MPWFNFDFGDFAKSFLSVLFEGIPFLLLGALVSGLVDVFVSSERITRLLPKRPGAAIFVAGLLGLIFPMCECGSVIVIRRFLKKGLPLSVATSYMLAAPIVSPIVAYSTWAAFKDQQPEVMVISRLGLGFLVAVAIALVIHNLPQDRIAQVGIFGETKRRTGLSIAGSPDSAEPADFAELVTKASPLRKVLLAIQSATADFLDVAFYFIIGVAITSVFAVGVDHSIIDPLAQSPATSIVTLMIVSALLALCSTTDAFVAASQFTQFSSAAKLAFLLFGPVFDLKLFWLYGLVFKRKFVVILALALFVLIALICILWGSIDAVPRSPGSIGTTICHTLKPVV